MPYAPGVQDIRGQLIAQGIGNAGNSVANALIQFQKKREDDAAAMAAAKSTLSFVKQNSNTLGISEGELDQLDALTKNPKVPAAAAAQAAHTMIQNSVLRQNAMEAKQQQEAQKFILQQAQAKKAQEDMQRAHLQQLDAFARAQNPAQVATDPNAARMNTELYGTPGGPMDVPADSQPTLTSQALDYFRATNRTMEPAEAGQYIAANYREDNARTRAEAAQQVADMRNQTRKEIEDAKREADQAKLDAKGKISFHTDPETGATVAFGNGQIVPIRSPEAKNPFIASVDAAVKSGEITPEEAVQFKKNYFKKGGEFSPTPWAQLGAMQGLGGQQAPVNNQPRPQGGPPQVSTQAQYDALPAGAQYIGPDGKLATKRGQ